MGRPFSVVFFMNFSYFKVKIIIIQNKYYEKYTS
jgi:hypothetical protein